MSGSDNYWQSPPAEGVALKLGLSFQDFQMGKADLQPFAAHGLKENRYLLILIPPLHGTDPSFPEFGVPDPHPCLQMEKPLRRNDDLFMGGNRTLL